MDSENQSLNDLFLQQVLEVVKEIFLLSEGIGLLIEVIMMIVKKKKETFSVLVVDSAVVIVANSIAVACNILSKLHSLLSLTFSCVRVWPFSTFCRVDRFSFAE